MGMHEALENFKFASRRIKEIIDKGGLSQWDPGLTYVFEFTGGVYKIGYTRDRETLKQRFDFARQELGSSAKPVLILSGGEFLEAYIHGMFADLRYTSARSTEIFRDKGKRIRDWAQKVSYGKTKAANLAVEPNELELAWLLVYEEKKYRPGKRGVSPTQLKDNRVTAAEMNSYFAAGEYLGKHKLFLNTSILGQEAKKIATQKQVESKRKGGKNAYPEWVWAEAAKILLSKK